MNKKNRVGQVRMTETVAVLFIFFILVVFGIIMYSQIYQSGFERREAEFVGESAITTTLNVLFLPELRCSKGENIPVRDCVDITKLNAAKQQMKIEEDYYFDIFGFSTINIKKIYPSPQQEFLLYQAKGERSTRELQTPVPISLYDPVEKKFYFGVLTVEIQT